MPALWIACVSCGGSGTTATITSPSATPKCAVSIDAGSASVPAEGGGGQIVVTTARECAWSAEPQNPWLSIKAGGSGQGDGVVEYAATANPDPVTRRGAIVLNSVRADISQGAASCTMRLSSSSAAFPPAGGSGRVDVSASSSLCAWTSSASAGWLTIRSGASGSGNGSVAFDVAPTTGPPRTATLTIAGQRFDVTESEGCTFAIAPASFTAPASGGTVVVAVAAASGCPWSAGSNADWIAVTAGTSGSGTGTATLSIAPTDGAGRTGTAVIAGQPFTVTQTQGCQFDVQPAAQTFSASGGSANVAVSTAPGCGWSASSNAPWITLDGPPAGSGPGGVHFSVQPTTGAARSGTLTVAGRTIAVSQSQGCSYAIAPESASVGSSGGAVKVAVTAGSGCSWTAASAVPWITIDSGASGNGDGTVQLVVAGTTGPGRSGTATIAGRTLTVTQGEGCTFAIAPETATAPPGGGPIAVTVSAPAGCGWTAASNTSWISVTSGASGSGNGSVQLSVAPTAGPSRSGTVTIAGRTLTVTQGDGCSVAISTTTATVPAGGGQGAFDVRAADGCSWSSASSASWLAITAGQSGAGNGTIRYSAAANVGAGRSATITVGGRPFTVTQDGGCSAELSAASQDVAAAGGSGTVGIATDATCTWSASSQAAWLTITSGQNGSGNGTVAFTAAANDGPARAGTLAIAGRTFTVNQPAGCSFSIAPDQQTVGADGAALTIAVTAPAGCTWTASANASWLTITSGASGSGNGSVGLTVAVNGGAARTGTATIAGRTLTITQTLACTFAIAPEQQAVDAAGGSAIVSVTAPDGCAWTAAANAPWLTIDGAASGTGSGAVQVSALANAGPARSGTASIAGRTFTVNQSSRCSVTLSATALTVPRIGGAGSVTVTADDGCAWTAASQVGWITITSGATGTGSGTVQFAVETRTAGGPRSGTILIAGQTFTVNQN